MAHITPVHYFPATIAVLLISILILTITAAQPPSPPPSGCSDTVLAFSPCLPYISAPPNNVTDEPSSQCCDVYGSAVDGGRASCVCYLFRRPLILGFPLNSTRLFALSSFCPVNDTGDDGISPLRSLCSGSQELPPLQSTGSGLSSPHGSGSGNSPPPSTTSETSPPPEPSDNNSTSEPSIPTAAKPTDISSASGKLYKNHNWFPRHAMILIVSIFCSL